MFNFCELNQNVLYIAETIRHSFRNASDDNDKLTKKLNLALKICLQCNDKLDESKLNEIKANIFYYLFGNYAGYKLLVPSPALNFDSIMHLAINSQFDDLYEIFEKFDIKTKSTLIENLQVFIDKIDQTARNEFFNSFLIFSSNLLVVLKFAKQKNHLWDLIETKLLRMLKTTCQSNVCIEFEQVKINEILIKVIEYLFDALNFNATKQKTPEEATNQLTSLFEANIQDIEYCTDLLLHLVSRKSHFSHKLHLNNSLPNALELLSLMSFMKKNEKLNQFYLYLKRLIEFSYDLDFNDYFIMKNRLVGFEILLGKNIFEMKNFGQLSEKDLEVLRCVKNHLKNETNLYLLLKMLDTLKINESNLHLEFLDLFWSIFDEVSLDIKLSLIANKIYKYHELKLTDNNLLMCLLDASFYSCLTITINQLSFENCLEPEILDKIIKLMCISIEILISKLIKNALNNKTQIPTLVKILSKLTILLNCKTTANSELDVINECLKKNLDHLIENHNEKMSQSYLLLLKELTKQTDDAKFNFNLFFSQILKTYLNIDSFLKFENNFVFAIEIFEVIYKKIPANVAHLVYFLKMLTFLNFFKTNEKRFTSQIISTKEKCFALIKQIVKYLNFQNPISSDELNWLIIQTKQIYWPYSIVIFALTKLVILPDCLKDLNKFSPVEYFEAKNTHPMSCVLELISVNADSNKFLEVINEKSFYDKIQDLLIWELSQNKTPNELKSIFEFFISNIKFIQIEIDPKLNDLADNESLGYAKFLQLFIENFYSISSEMNTDYLLSNFYVFLKGYCTISQNKNGNNCLKFILITVYSIQKLFMFIKVNAQQELCRFIIELLNHAAVLGKNQSNEIRDLVGLCKNTSVLLDENENKSYKYLINQKFDSLLN